MRIDFIDYFALFTADFPAGATTLPISAEDAQILVDGLGDGDYTYLQISGQLFTEVIKVTKVGSVLQVERAVCDSEEHNFLKGDCVLHYKNADACEGVEPEECECTLCDLESPDNSILLNSTACEISVNPDIIPPDVGDWLCELTEVPGELLSGDFMLAITKLQNGECIFKVFDTDSLCDRLIACLDGVGIPGPQGDAGLDGEDGAPGNVGPAGPVGNTGVTGTTGPAGVQGPQGPAGASGSSITAPGDWLDITASSIRHNSPQALDSTLGNGVQIDAKGHVVGYSAINGEMFARYSGNPGIGSTGYTKNLSVFYGVVGTDPSVFTFSPAFPSNNYFISVQKADGSNAGVGIVGKTTNGFQLSGPVANQDLVIFVHE
jgi:hypothetical protein